MKQHTLIAERAFLLQRLLFTHTAASDNAHLSVPSSSFSPHLSEVLTHTVLMKTLSVSQQARSFRNHTGTEGGRQGGLEEGTQHKPVHDRDTSDPVLQACPMSDQSDLDLSGHINTLSSLSRSFSSSWAVVVGRRRHGVVCLAFKGVWG